MGDVRWPAAGLAAGLELARLPAAAKPGAQRDREQARELVGQRRRADVVLHGGPPVLYRRLQDVRRVLLDPQDDARSHPGPVQPDGAQGVVRPVGP